MMPIRSPFLPPLGGGRRRLVSALITVGAVWVALIAGEITDRVGLRTCAVVIVVCTVWLGAFGTDQAARVSVLLIPFIGILRRITAGDSGYVPSDPVIAVCLLLLLPAVCAPLRGPLTRSARWLAVLAGWLVVEALASLAQGALVSAVYSTLTAVVPVLLAVQLAMGRSPGLPDFAARWTPRVAVVTALYSVVQWLAPPRWDLAWLTTVQDQFVSVGLPRPGEFRIFGTMESPGAYAAFLGVAAVLLVSRPLPARYRGAQVLGRTAALAVIIVALSLTAVRSVLLPLPLAVMAMLFLRGGRSRSVGLPLIIASTPLLVVLPQLLGNSARAESRYDLGNITQDESFNARVELLRSFVSALANPIGTGLGTTGNAAAGTGGLSVVDNGYLARTLETGTVGLLLFLAGATAVLLPALRRAPRVSQLPVPWIGVVVFFLIYELSSSFIGAAVGVYFWIGMGAIALQLDRVRSAVGSAGAVTRIAEEGRLPSPSGSGRPRMDRLSGRPDERAWIAPTGPRRLMR